MENVKNIVLLATDPVRDAVSANKPQQPGNHQPDQSHNEAGLPDSFSRFARRLGQLLAAAGLVPSRFFHGRYGMLFLPFLAGGKGAGREGGRIVFLFLPRIIGRRAFMVGGSCAAIEN